MTRQKWYFIFAFANFYFIIFHKNSREPFAIAIHVLFLWFYCFQWNIQWTFFREWMPMPLCCSVKVKTSRHSRAANENIVDRKVRKQLIREVSTCPDSQLPLSFYNLLVAEAGKQYTGANDVKRNVVDKMPDINFLKQANLFHFFSWCFWWTHWWIWGWHAAIIHLCQQLINARFWRCCLFFLIFTLVLF